MTKAKPKPKRTYPKGKTTLSVYLDLSLLDDLKKLADAERRTVSSLVGVICEDAVRKVKGQKPLRVASA